LSVLAQAGEGSVRDSLSALDQAIACCGVKLDAAEVRELLGVFSLEALQQVAQALTAADSRRMLDIVAELEANGRSLQHFARELARYFRNLLVVKISGVGTKLIAATPEEQQKLSGVAGGFGEEDLTRYLQLTLDLFKDLQASLQPRLHLELGLLRLVHAGKLQSIEEAIAGLSSASGGQPPRPAGGPPAAPSSSKPTRASAASVVTQDLGSAPQLSAHPIPSNGDLRSRVHAALVEAKLTHVADALEHSELTESGNDVVVTTPKMYMLYLKSLDFEATVKRVLGRMVKITIKAGEAQVAPVQAASAGTTVTDATAERALAHPEVQRFQEMFPGSQVRTVRNLKETES
ncbi:MAG TPA: DNA polymerase III subunit gamma/tau, partial [Bryobacteraceae bacterium]|nr:DNA polymerase III subunit gamma/tau [Bryobacteraceae bacterium]